MLLLLSLAYPPPTPQFILYTVSVNISHITSLLCSKSVTSHPTESNFPLNAHKALLYVTPDISVRCFLLLLPLSLCSRFNSPFVLPVIVQTQTFEVYCLSGSVFAAACAWKALTLKLAWLIHTYISVSFHSLLSASPWVTFIDSLIGDTMSHLSLCTRVCIIFLHSSYHHLTNYMSVFFVGLFWLSNLLMRIRTMSVL